MSSPHYDPPLGIGDTVRASLLELQALKELRTIHYAVDFGDGSPDGVVLCHEDAHSWPCPTAVVLHLDES